MPGDPPLSWGSECGDQSQDDQYDEKFDKGEPPFAPAAYQALARLLPGSKLMDYNQCTHLCFDPLVARGILLDRQVVRAQNRRDHRANDDRDNNAKPNGDQWYQ